MSVSTIFVYLTNCTKATLNFRNMKANKAKTSNKAEKKVGKQRIKKDLEVSIAAKFLDALKALGHDAEKFSKEIRKTSKELAKKIAKKYKEAKVAVEDKIVSGPGVKTLSPVKKPVSAPKKVVAAAIKKAEKVVAKVQKTTVNPEKSAVKKPVAAGSGATANKSGNSKAAAQKKPVVKKKVEPKSKPVN